MQVKVFIHKIKCNHPKWWGGRPIHFNHAECEDEINNWLDKNEKIRVVDMKQSTSGGSLGTNPPYITTSIWYEVSSL